MVSPKGERIIRRDKEGGLKGFSLHTRRDIDNTMVWRAAGRATVVGAAGTSGANEISDCHKNTDCGYCSKTTVAARTREGEVH